MQTETDDPILDLCARIVRGADPAIIRNSLQRVLDIRAIEDAFVIAFYVRDARGGKGERALFNTLLEVLNAEYPALCCSMADLIPEFGSWRDVFVLAHNFLGRRLGGILLNMAASQLLADASSTGTISLCAKWAPREGKHMDNMARRLALLVQQKLSDDRPPACMANYRRLVAGLNRRLTTVETLMSDGHWADINPADVPVRASKLYARAFLNLVRKNDKEVVDHTKLRHPGDTDRMICREKFYAHVDVKHRSQQILTLYENVRRVLDDPRYDVVRARVRNSGFV